jgi:ribose transport system ATP-binding protein
MRLELNTILQLSQINKSFSGVQVLHSIQLTLHKGEVLCLVGENGAGKSTLIKILSGAEYPDNGEINIFGTSYSQLTPSQSMKLGISTIYQDVDLVDTLSVADNVFLNTEITSKVKIINTEKQEELAKELFERISMKINPSSLVSSLSPGQKQNLQIAKALHQKAEILIMDEPTASLGEEETKSLMKLVKKLKKEGIGIIYISHYLDEIFAIGDTAIVLKDGHYVSTRSIKNTNQEELIRDMVGRDTSSLYIRKGRYSRNDNTLELQHFTQGTLVNNISFTVSKGEIFGIGGLVGSGRTELVRLLFGADKYDKGRLLFKGKDITPKNPKDAIKKGICYVSEDRKQEGLFLQRSTAENISIIKNDSSFFLNLKKEKEEVSAQISSLDIRVFNQEHEAGKLSGGNQQKVAIARWLLSGGEIFIFDEPSKGVDIGAREEIYQLMESLARAGKIVIMVSSTMTELLSLSDRIGVMREGKLVSIVDHTQATEDSLLKLYIGM